MSTENEHMTNKGFSLIELLITIALLGIILAIATMNSEIPKQHRLSSASRGLYSDLQRIRQKALTESSAANSRGTGIRFASNNSYTVFEYNDSNTDYSYSGAGEESGQSQKNLPADISVTIGAAGDPTGDILLYDKRGVTRTTSWTSSGSKTYVLRCSGVSQARCIVAEGAMIREGNWNGTTCTAQ